MKKNPFRYLVLGLLALVALIAVVHVLPTQHALGLVGVLCALPILGTVTVLPEADFQTKVLGGIEAQKTKTDQLVSNFDNLEKETKKSFEDLTKLKKTANDTAEGFTAFQKKLGEIEVRLRQEARSAFGDPAKRISGDEDLRLRFNAALRLSMSNDGDLMRSVRAKFPADFVKKALGEDSSPGSTLINDALAQEIYDTLAMYGVWNTFGVRRLGTKITKYPVKTVRPVANFILTEGGTIADDTNKAGTSVSLEAEVVGVLMNVSRQLLDDAEFDLTADVLNDFAEAFAYRLDFAALRADGTADATNGGMTGVFAGGTASVAAATHTTAETLVFEDVTKVLLSVDAGVLGRQCRWWMNPQILIRLLSIKDSNGRPIFLTALEAPTAGGIGSILGYPVMPAHAAPTTNAASAKLAVFGDPNAQVVGIRNDFAFEASDHHKWNTFERSFRGIGRAGVKIRRSAGLAVLTTAAS